MPSGMSQATGATDDSGSSKGSSRQTNTEPLLATAPITSMYGTQAGADDSGGRGGSDDGGDESACAMGAQSCRVVSA